MHIEGNTVVMAGGGWTSPIALIPKVGGFSDNAPWVVIERKVVAFNSVNILVNIHVNIHVKCLRRLTSKKSGSYK